MTAAMNPDEFRTALENATKGERRQIAVQHGL